MNLDLSGLGFTADKVIFGDLKTRYSKTYPLLSLPPDSLLIQIGKNPGPVAQVLLAGKPEIIQTNNVLEWEFFHSSPLLNIANCAAANEELCSLIWEHFPVDALDPNIPPSIGFLQEVGIRSNLVEVSDRALADPQMHRHIVVDGRPSWNLPVLHALPASQDSSGRSLLSQAWGLGRNLVGRRRFHYRFVFAFFQEDWRFIDFDARLASLGSVSWRLLSWSTEAP